LQALQFSLQYRDAVEAAVNVMENAYALNAGTQTVAQIFQRYA
jgi:isoaspartyl peptidase/L-asparaginase-like protein (Ntn-hydrolase superfamily)